MSIHGKAPISYAEWHELYHELTKMLGFTTMSYWRWKLDGIDPSSLCVPGCDAVSGTFRRMIYAIRRIQRVEAHLDRAAERNDVTHQEHAAWIDSIIRGDGDQ